MKAALCAVVAVVLCGIPLPGFAAAANTYVANWHSGVINKITSAGVVSTFASGLSDPSGLALDTAGDVFEADEGSGDIFEFSPSGVKSTFATGLGQPYGITVGVTGLVYVTTVGSGSIALYEFSANGQMRTTLATNSSGLINAHGLALDRNGNLFVADFNRVDEFTPGGVESTFGTAPSGAQGLAFSPGGTLFLTDGQSDIYSYSSNGTQTLYGTIPTNTGGIAFDAIGDMYVEGRGADFTSGVVYKYDTGNNQTTFASGLSDPQMGIANALPTPEPTACVLLACGAAGLLLRRGRQTTAE